MEIPTYFADPGQLLTEFEKLDRANTELEKKCTEEEEKVHRLEQELETEVAISWVQALFGVLVPYLNVLTELSLQRTREQCSQIRNRCSL
jgi:predicted RNase H-like nuclease (RuvC/YqgF family)